MKDIAGRNFTVVEQSQMNDALKQYGYPVDAILSPPLATTLAKNIQARVLMTGTLARGGGGRTRHRPTHRGQRRRGKRGDPDPATGTEPGGLREEAGPALAPAVKSLPDAKACIDQRTTKPDKAAEAAKKAIKTLPNHGLAEFCLAQIAMDKKAPRGEVVKHLQASVKGDPLSLPVWTALADPVSGGQRHGQYAACLQADAPRGTDQPEAAGGAVQVLPAVRPSGDRA